MNKEAELIKKELNECDWDEVSMRMIEGIIFIRMKNPDYQPDNGSNPYRACTLDELLDALGL